MFVLLNAALISLVQLGVLIVAGLGLTWLTTPAHLRACRVLVAPAFGMALLALIGFYGTNMGYALRQLAPVTGLMALLLLLAAYVYPRRAIPPVPTPQRENTAAADPHLSLSGRELVILAGVLVLVWLLHIAPVLHYGILMPIGHNADVEYYLPLADYLRDYSYPTLDQIPPTTGRAVLLGNGSYTDHSVTMRAMGATYAQTTIDIVGGWRAWESWVPMLATLRVVALASLYALLRGGLGLPSSSALLGVGLAGINGLLLWTTYNSYGMSTGAVALLPATVLWTRLALDQGGWKALTGGAVLLGGMTCVYWPILLAYGTLGAGVAGGLLWEQRHRLAGIWRIAQHGVVLLVGAGALSWLAQLRLPRAWLGDFAAQPASMGIETFFSPAVIVGTAPVPGPWIPTYTGIWQTVAWVGVALASMLLLRGIWQGSRHRALAIGLAASCILFLLLLRFVLAYPYGYARGASYIATVLLGLVGSGLVVPTRHNQQPPLSSGKWSRRAAPLTALLLLILCAAASYRIYATYANQPGFVSIRAAHERVALKNLDTPGAVLFSPAAASALCGSPAMAWGNALYQREMIGILQSTYATLDNRHNGTNPAYYVVRRAEDISRYGLSQAEQVWQNERVGVYRRPAGRAAWLDGRMRAAGLQPLCVTGDSTYTRARLGHAPYVTIDTDAPLTLYAAENRLSRQPISPMSEDAVTQDIVLELATHQAQQVTLTVDDVATPISLPAGVSTYQTALSLPARLTITDAEAPILLRQASLHESQSLPDSPAVVSPDTVFISLASQRTARGATVSMDIVNTSPQVLNMVLEIYQDVRGYETAPHHYAQAVLPQADTLDLRLDLDQQTVLTVNGTELPLTIDQPAEGSYFVAVWVYQGEELRQVIPLLHFERHQQGVHTVQSSDLNGVMLPVLTPRQPVDIAAGSVTLHSYELSAKTVLPGEPLNVAMLWQANATEIPLYWVSIQVLDAANTKIAQWDGVAGGEAYPTSRWQKGQHIWQNIPLTIAQDTPPGTYRMIVRLYDPTTGEPLELEDSTDRATLGTIEVLP